MLRRPVSPAVLAMVLSFGAAAGTGAAPPPHTLIKAAGLLDVKAGRYVEELERVTFVMKGGVIVRDSSER